MASITLSVEDDVATRQDPAYGAGLGDHLPVGYWSGAKYRSAIRFIPPSGWTGWSGLTKATLNIFVSDHQHVGITNAGVYIRKQNESDLWTKAAGSQDCESGFSSSNTTQYADLAALSSQQVGFSSGTTANAKKSINVTAMVDTMRGAAYSRIVFIIDPQDSSDYTEFWSNNSPSNSYDPKLVLEYETEQPPLAPTLVNPVANAALADDTPTFQWTHNATQSDPQLNAEVAVLNAAGTVHQPGSPMLVPGAGNLLTWPTALPRGLGYMWWARTQDVTGWGAYAAGRAFSVKSNPTVTMSPTRKMVWENGQPRLIVEWSVDASHQQDGYTITAPGEPATYHPGGATSHTLSIALVNGTPVTVTVTVSDVDGLIGSATQTFTPRYGYTVHHRDLTAAPKSWGTPSVVATIPVGASIKVQYAANATGALPAEADWKDSISSVPKAQHLFWRAWLIPSATAGPTLDTITIPTDTSVVLVDKWSTTRGGTTLDAPWEIDPGESVYGTRSMYVKVAAAGETKVYSIKTPVKTGRSYILTGLMKSDGDSGAHFRLEDTAGNIIQAGLFDPLVPMTSEVLHQTLPWYNAEQYDVRRYKTPVWHSTFDGDVHVVLVANGAVGSQAWWDAIKLEESSVATAWSPAAIGATVMDAGGIQIDGFKGGVFRYRGSLNGGRDFVEGGPHGLIFGVDTELSSPSTGVLEINGKDISTEDHTHPTAPPAANRNWRFVRIPLITVVNNVVSNGSEQTLELPQLPANDPTVVAAWMAAMVRDPSSTNNYSFTVKDFDGSSALLGYTSGSANRGGSFGPGIVMVGGTNNRQMKYTATSGAAMYLYVLGYWVVDP